MVNLIAIIVIYSIFFMGCATKHIMINCEKMNSTYYSCEKP